MNNTFTPQVFNPYLPSWEYIPDGEPHIFGDRVYIYGSHDRFNGKTFSLNDYVCWSAPVDNLKDWRYEGIILRKKQDPHGKFGGSMYAPDVCRGADGKYYLYYFLPKSGLLSVAVCDSPAGKFEFLGHVKHCNGTPIGKKDEPIPFDPGIFIDDDGRIYLYLGFGPLKFGRHKITKHGAFVYELESDMLTVKSDLKYIGVKGISESKSTPYEGHEFFEASSMRKFNGKYYFIYSSYLGHELCYAVSDNPVNGFEYGGTLVSNGDVGLNGRTDAINYTGNTHGSLIEINGKYYVFYHRQTNRHLFSRQACAEEIIFASGKFQQAEITSCGLNGGPLVGFGEYEARIACNLFSNKGTYEYGMKKRPEDIHPYFTQSGKDRESKPDQYISNFCDGATAGFKYYDIKKAENISVSVRGNANGILTVTDDTKTVAKIKILPCKDFTIYSSPLDIDNGIKPLFFTYSGVGKFDFISFKIY